MFAEPGGRLFRISLGLSMCVHAHMHEMSLYGMVGVVWKNSVGGPEL